MLLYTFETDFIQIAVKIHKLNFKAFELNNDNTVIEIILISKKRIGIIISINEEKRYGKDFISRR